MVTLLVLSVQKYHSKEELSTRYFFEREKIYLKNSPTRVKG
jgi:hypothetical protein